MKPHAVSLKVAHPAILRATVARKKKELLNLSCSSCEMFRFFHKRLVAELRTNPLIRDRMRRLMAIPGFKKYGKCPWFYLVLLVLFDLDGQRLFVVSLICIRGVCENGGYCLFARLFRFPEDRGLFCFMGIQYQPFFF